MIVYFNGEFLPKTHVRVSPDDRGFLFGDGVYEAIRADCGRLFAAGPHFQRLARSLRELRITEPDLAEIQAAIDGVLERNVLLDCKAAIYIQITRGAAPRRHAFPEGDVLPTVYVTARAFTPPDALLANGAKVILAPDTRWGRCDIKSLNLLPNVLASQQAREAGAYDAVFVREGVAIEGSHTSFAAVFDGTLVTHPLTPHILSGVTRQVVLNLCRKLGIPTREAPIRAAALRDADELMLLGTTTEVMPVVQVNEWSVRDGQPGKITQRLQTAIRNKMEAL